MKKNYFITGIALFAATALSAQIKTIRPAMQTKVQTTTAKPELVHVESAKPTTPPPVNKDIQPPSISITSGDDGKEEGTAVNIYIWDNNKRTAAYFNWDFSKEYFAGTTVTLPMVTQPSIPTGEMKMNGSLPVPVYRMATQADFSNGGELRIELSRAGSNDFGSHNDIWKIKTIRLRVSFNNDNASPHTITWDNITLSSTSSFSIDLLFDKNLNAIQ